MDSDLSRERTAKWVQSQFASGSSRQPHTHLSTSKTNLQRTHSLTNSNQTDSTSRTAISQPRRSSNAAPVSSPQSGRHHPSTYRAQTQHHASVRPYVPTEIYRKVDLPAFVQGPPGSGFPRTMPVSPLSASVMVVKPPSPPLNIPTPLNPKKSRPAVHKRRPSLSGTSFEPPERYMDAGNQEKMPRRRANSESRYR